jgi:hypothetical protein
MAAGHNPRGRLLLAVRVTRCRVTASPGRRFATTLTGVCAQIARSKSGRGTKMAAEQGMGTGRVPGLNTERIYSTTVPADELARALADHFRAQGFETQVFRTSGDRTAMQARKESLWRNLLGVAYALTVTLSCPAFSGQGILRLFTRLPAFPAARP